MVKKKAKQLKAVKKVKKAVRKAVEKGVGAKEILDTVAAVLTEPLEKAKPKKDPKPKKAAKKAKV